MRWERVRPNARARETPDGRKTPGRAGGIWGPGVRWGHTCNAVKGGRLVYIFGGYGADNCQTNEVHVFNTVKHAWSKPMMKGVPPSPRDSHSCTTVGNRLFVFGGTDGKTPLKDLHILDTSSNTWIIPALHGEGPEAREGHTATIVGKRFFIFGGCGKSGEDEEVYYNDLYILDTEKLIWERAVTSGVPPSARDSHTSTSLNNKIVVLGGEDSSDSYLSDVHMLDAETLVWKQVCTTGQMLAPRAGHTTVALGNDLFVFGGFTDDRNLYDDLHVLNVDTGLWKRVTTVDQGPSARFSVAGDCLDERKGILVFIGGCNKDLEALDDMYYLHTDIHVENGQSERRQKYSLKRELKKKCQEIHLPLEGFEKDVHVPMIGRMASPLHPVNDQEGNQSGTKTSSRGVTFEAKVTNTNQNGYAIKTVIDGKLFHGMIFTCTSSFDQDNHDYPNKKRPNTEVFGDELNKYQPNLKAAGSTNHGQTDSACSKEPVSNLNSLTCDADVSQPNTHIFPKISGPSEPSFAPLRDLDSGFSDSPSKPGTGKPCEPPSASNEEMQVSAEPEIGSCHDLFEKLSTPCEEWTDPTLSVPVRNSCKDADDNKL